MISYANAKINIGLAITGKRPDGYHNLETIFYPFPLYDILEITEKGEGDTHLTITGLDLLVEPDNLCLRAYRLLQERFDLPAIHIHLHKQIPFGAGLGGGSSDAATLINMLNSKYELNLSVDEREAMAATLGADCPFFIENKVAYAEGIGTELSPFDLDLSSYYMVLVKPDAHVSTAEAYRHVQAKAPAADLRELVRLPVDEWEGRVKNDFEDSVFRQFPIVEELKNALYAAGATYVSMSGSGSSVFALFSEQRNVDELSTFGTIYYPVTL